MSSDQQLHHHHPHPIYPSPPVSVNNTGSAISSSNIVHPTPDHGHSSASQGSYPHPHHPHHLHHPHHPHGHQHPFIVTTGEHQHLHHQSSYTLLPPSVLQPTTANLPSSNGQPYPSQFYPQSQHHHHSITTVNAEDGHEHHRHPNPHPPYPNNLLLNQPQQTILNHLLPASAPLSTGTASSSSATAHAGLDPTHSSANTSLSNKAPPQQQQNQPNSINSDPNTTASSQPPQDFKRRRYRIPRSCDRCRASKIKCVFENGRCAACVSSGVPCTFANPGSLKERPPTQKDVEHLQARIRSLERLIHAVSPSIDLNNLPDPEHLHSCTPKVSSHAPDQATTSPGTHQPLSPSATSSPPGQPSAHADPSARPSTIAPVFSASHWSQPDHPSPSRKYVGITFDSSHYVGTNSVFSLPDSAAHLAWSNLPTSVNKSAELSPVDKIIRNQYQQRIFGSQQFYPEPDLENDLLTLFFKHVHPFLTIIHLPSFMQLYRSGAAQSDTSFRSLCLFVFALASRFSDDPRVLLDMEGNSHPSRQIAGLRYCFSAASYLYRPIATPATLYDLQSYVLMSIYSLGTVSPMTSWSVVGIGLQRAQEAGAHREQSHTWTANPLRDLLRRKAFFALYELDNGLSAILGRTAYMQEEDFDLVPQDVEADINIGMFVNPFTDGNPKIQQALLDAQRAWASMTVTVGGFRSLLPVLNSMHTRGGAEGRGLVGSVKSIVDEIDSGMRRWYEQVSGSLRECNPNPSREELIASVSVTTWYHEFRLLIHRTLFDEEEQVGEEVAAEGEESMSCLKKCVRSASILLGEMNKLKERGCLGEGFYWIPTRVTAAAIVLICSIRREQSSANEKEIEQRRKDVELAISILHDLSSSTYTAEACEKTVSKLYELIDLEPVNHQSIPTNPTPQEPQKPNKAELEQQAERGFDPLVVSNAMFDFS